MSQLKTYRDITEKTRLNLFAAIIVVELMFMINGPNGIKCKKCPTILVQ